MSRRGLGLPDLGFFSCNKRLLEAIASRLEAIAIRVEAIAIRLARFDSDFM